MRTFKDSAGREWTISMTIGSAQRVRDLLKINLMLLEEGTPPLMSRLGDPFLLANIIFCLIKPQADEKGITDIAFGESLGGDAFFNAHMAFIGELSDFYQSLTRTDLVRTLAQMQVLMKGAVARAEAKITAMDPTKTLDALFGETSTGLPEPSASTPSP